MRREIINLRYNQYLNEVKKHVSILQEDFKSLEEYYPFNEKDIQNFLSDDNKLKILDQIAYRFLKMQDTLGKLLKFFLLKKGEIIENLSMIDIIHKVEKFGISIDEDFWFEIRALRNSLTHDYPELYSEIAVSLNILYESFPKIVDIFNQIKLKGGS